jgi:hypothetical protein
MIRYMLIMDSRDYDIHLSSITTCSHAVGYDVNVNTKRSMICILKKVQLLSQPYIVKI